MKEVEITITLLADDDLTTDQMTDRLTAAGALRKLEHAIKSLRVNPDHANLDDKIPVILCRVEMVRCHADPV